MVARQSPKLFVRVQVLMRVPLYADVVQWQNTGLPSLECEFNSRYLLQYCREGQFPSEPHKLDYTSATLVSAPSMWFVV